MLTVAEISLSFAVATDIQLKAGTVRTKTSSKSVTAPSNPPKIVIWKEDRSGAEETTAQNWRLGSGDFPVAVTTNQLADAIS